MKNNILKGKAGLTYKTVSAVLNPFREDYKHLCCTHIPALIDHSRVRNNYPVIPKKNFSERNIQQ
jgi:hypothetical protein